MPPARRLAFAAGLSARLVRSSASCSRCPESERRRVPGASCSSSRSMNWWSATSRLVSVYTIPWTSGAAADVSGSSGSTRCSSEHADMHSLHAATSVSRCGRSSTISSRLPESERRKSLPFEVRRPSDEPEPMTVEEPAEPPLEDHIMSRSWL